MASSLKSLLGGSGGVPIGGALDITSSSGTPPPELNADGAVYLRGGIGATTGTKYAGFLSTFSKQFSANDVYTYIYEDTSTPSLWMTSAASGAGIFLLAGYEPSGGVLVSEDKGNTWQVYSVTGGTYIADTSAAAYGAGNFVVFVNENAYTSTDGKVWVDRGAVLNAGDYATASIYDGAAFIVGTASGALFRSTDGITWSSIASPLTASQLVGGVAGGGVRLMWTSNKHLIRSTDGLTWTEITYPFSTDNVGAIGYAATSTFICVHGAGGVHKSTDGGVTWVARTTIAGFTGYKAVACVFRPNVWQIMAVDGKTFTALQDNDNAWSAGPTVPFSVDFVVASSEVELAIAGTPQVASKALNTALSCVPTQSLVANGYARYVRVK